MTLVNPTARAEVLRRVQAALDRYQPRKYRIEVDPDGILEDNAWYHIVVKSPDDVRDRDFYDALGSAETDLNEQNDGHQYLLVPAIAE